MLPAVSLKFICAGNCLILLKPWEATRRTNCKFSSLVTTNSNSPWVVFNVRPWFWDSRNGVRNHKISCGPEISDFKSCTPKSNEVFKMSMAV